MSVLREQFLRRTTATLANATLNTIDILGPETPAEPPYAENTDHVTRLRQTKQNLAGGVQIMLPATFKAANIFMRAVEIWSRNSTAGQKGLSAPLYPSGATPATSTPYLVRTVFSEAANSLLCSDDAAVAILGGVIDTDAEKHHPLISLNADEFVRLSIYNNTGGPVGPGVIESKFDLGLNPAVGGSQP